MSAILAGKKFGRWTVLSEAPSKIRPNGKRRRIWHCKCECGKSSQVHHSNLLSGGSQSCGCLKIEITITRCTTHGCAEYGNPTAEYRAWQAIHNRCSNPKYVKYHLYGGRGIKVCASWDSFEAFLSDMGIRPSDKHTLDRKDTNGDYELSNCRWATWKEQQNNRRNNFLIEWKGKTQTAAQWEQQFGWRQCLVNRIKHYGWTIERAMLTPPKKKKK